MEGVLSQGIDQMPLGWQIWVYWMMFLNTISLFFIFRTEARWILAAWIANVITMTLLAEQIGYVRLLGISHVIWWTPLMVYLALKLPSLDRKSLYGVWVVALLITDSISLVIDYVDVVRYVLGERDEVLYALAGFASGA